MEDNGKLMNSKQLNFNKDKTECLIVGKNNDLRKLDISIFRINDNTMMKKVANDLGVILILPYRERTN